MTFKYNNEEVKRVIYKGQQVTRININGVMRWEVDLIVITFNSNGGSEVNNIIGYAEMNITPPVSPTKTGYTFAGWYKNSNLSEAYIFTKMPQQNITIYAKWISNSYVVEYAANGGVGLMGLTSHTYNEEKALSINTFSKTGYNFVGWATSSNGSVVYGNGESVLNLSSTSTTIMMYAKWQAITYTVRYEANGGQGAMTSTLHTYDTLRGLNINGFSRSGYSFEGWSTNSLGSVLYANGQYVVNLTTTNNANVTLYAKWKNALPIISKKPQITATLTKAYPNELKHEVINNNGFAVELIFSADNGLEYTKVVPALGKVVSNNEEVWSNSITLSAYFKSNGYINSETTTLTVTIPGFGGPTDETTTT